jgi:hypothetical protein
VCVLAFFQIATTKERLLEELDQSMIDPGRVTELQVLVAPVAYK